MTANIWNTYEMVGAATTGVLIGGIPAIAIMMWKRWDGSVELAEAKQWWGKAMSVAAANDRARWAPHYSGNLNAEPHVTGEVLAIESVERCCTAHGDEPCAQDSGFVPPYCCGDCPDRMPALSDQSHEDEQAAEENDDHTGAGRWLLATLIRICSDLYDRIADAWHAWRTRDNGESDAEAFAVEVAAMREAERDRAIAEEIAELTGEPVRPVAAVIDRELRKTLYLPTGAVPMVKLTGAEPGHHRKVEAEDAEPVEVAA